MTPRLPSSRRGLNRLHGDQNGRVTAFVVVIVTAILLFAGLVLDGGLVLAAKVRAVGEAQEAARAGAQEIDLTAYRADGTLRLAPQQATAAARSYLAAAGHTGTVSVAGNTVNVTVTVSQPTQLLGLIGIGSITVTATGQAQPQRGINGEDREFANSAMSVGETKVLTASSNLPAAWDSRADGQWWTRFADLRPDVGQAHLVPCCYQERAVGPPQVLKALVRDVMFGMCGSCSGDTSGVIDQDLCGISCLASFRHEPDGHHRGLKVLPVGPAGLIEERHHLIGLAGVRSRGDVGIRIKREGDVLAVCGEELLVRRQPNVAPLTGVVSPPQPILVAEGQPTPQRNAQQRNKRGYSGGGEGHCRRPLLSSWPDTRVQVRSRILRSAANAAGLAPAYGTASVGIAERGFVAFGAADEQFAQSVDVAAGGVQYPRDAVSTRDQGGDAEAAGEPVGMYKAAVGGVAVKSERTRVPIVDNSSGIATGRQRLHAIERPIPTCTP